MANTDNDFFFFLVQLTKLLAKGNKTFLGNTMLFIALKYSSFLTAHFGGKIRILY